MPTSKPTFATTNSVRAERTALPLPGTMKVSQAVAPTETRVAAARKRRRRPERSAIAPSTGETRAMIRELIVIPRDHSAVPRSASSAKVCEK